MKRPHLLSAWKFFSEVNQDVQNVGRKIGGRVQSNIDAGIFQNACPIRMSYVLNYVGIPIPGPSSKYSVVSGGDKKWYMFRVNDMMSFLEDTFGKPDITVASPMTSDFYKARGIIVVKGSGWSNARGHVTLWDGGACSDICHLTGDPENGSFVPETASIWKLP